MQKVRGGGSLPYISHIGMCRSKGQGFAPFWCGIGCGFQGNYGCVRTYLSFQFQMSKKEREIGNSNGILRYIFCCCSNLSIDDIISLRPGLRMGIDFYRGHFPLRTVHPSAKPRNYRKDLSTAGPKYMQLNSFHLNYGYVGISSFSGDKSRLFSYS